jgi:hypothetical protein
LASVLPFSPVAPATSDEPVINVARIGSSGDAVIAGGLRQARVWNCYATVRSTMVQSRIDLANS